MSKSARVAFALLVAHPRRKQYCMRGNKEAELGMLIALVSPHIHTPHLPRKLPRNSEGG